MNQKSTASRAPLLPPLGPWHALGLLVASIAFAGCSCSDDDTPGLMACDENDDCPNNQCDLEAGTCVSTDDGGGGCDPEEDLCECTDGCEELPPTGPGKGGTGFDVEDEDTSGVGVNDDGELILDSTQINTRVIWIANTTQGTVAKINTDAPYEELGRYQTSTNGPVGGYFAGNDPSRTSVNVFSDVYVGNRRDMSVTKISVLGDRCPDKNGDGVVTTSTGPDDIKPWVDNEPTDECILWHAPLAQPSGGMYGLVRAVAAQEVMGPDGALESYVWVGVWHEGGSKDRIDKLDGDTGELLLSTTSPVKPYGFALDGAGNLWVASYGSNAIARIDTNACTDSATCDAEEVCDDGDAAAGDACVKQRITHPNNTYFYGITVDAQQRVWVGGNRPQRYDPDAAWAGRWQEILSNAGTISGSRGIGATTTFAYLAASNGTIVQVPINDPAGGVPLMDTSGDAYGIAIDLDGKVWGIERNRAYASVVTPTATLGTAAVEDGPDGLINPYTYSDMTGSQLRLATNPRGYYREQYAGCGEGAKTVWGKLDYQVETPPGTSVVFRVRTATTEAGLGAAEWVTVAVIPDDAPPADIATALEAAGVAPEQYLEVEVQLIAEVASLETAITPVVKGFGVTRSCPASLL